MCSLLLQYGPDHLLHDGVPEDVPARPAGGAVPHPGLAGPADPVAVLAAVDLTSHSLQTDRALGNGFIASGHFQQFLVLILDFLLVIS